MTTKHPRLVSPARYSANSRVTSKRRVVLLQAGCRSWDRRPARSPPSAVISFLRSSFAMYAIPIVRRRVGMPERRSPSPLSHPVVSHSRRGQLLACGNVLHGDLPFAGVRINPLLLGDRRDLAIDIDLACRRERQIVGVLGTAFDLKRVTGKQELPIHFERGMELGDTRACLPLPCHLAARIVHDIYCHGEILVVDKSGVGAIAFGQFRRRGREGEMRLAFGVGRQVALLIDLAGLAPVGIVDVGTAPVPAKVAR